MWTLRRSQGQLERLLVTLQVRPVSSVCAGESEQRCAWACSPNRCHLPAWHPAPVLGEWSPRRRPYHINNSGRMPQVARPGDEPVALGSGQGLNFLVAHCSGMLWHDSQRDRTHRRRGLRFPTSMATAPQESVRGPAEKRAVGPQCSVDPGSSWGPQVAQPVGEEGA